MTFSGSMSDSNFKQMDLLYFVKLIETERLNHNPKTVYVFGKQRKLLTSQDFTTEIQEYFGTIKYIYSSHSERDIL